VHFAANPPNRTDPQLIKSARRSQSRRSSGSYIP
jgi:hypothetical protein